MKYTKKRNRRSTEGGPSNNRPNHKRQNNRKSRGKSGLNPQMLIRKNQEATTVESFTAQLPFEQMAISSQLKANLKRKNFDYPTEIQERTIEELTAGRDLVGIAHTGTGKTGAFLIPIIEQLQQGNRSFSTLVVLPTRELALQVEEEFKGLSRDMGFNVASFIGGTKVNNDLKQLRKQNHLIIGTPGRLTDLINRRALKLDEIEILVLDEFDRMLDMGFVDEIQAIVRKMDSRRQTMLFSATIDKTQKGLVADLLTDPMHISVTSGSSASEQVEQDIIQVPKGEDKFELLLGMMQDNAFEKVLIFAETKRQVDKVTKGLKKSGVRAELIHGDKSQGFRTMAMKKFRQGRIQVLVATDVAARGIDVSDITHVINYQMPQSFDSYIHRIGRTGRAGKTGKAFTFVD